MAKSSTPTQEASSGRQVGCGPIAKSKMGPRRAAVLILVHLAVFAHILHWKLTGSTLSPIEPSESMFTLELGYLNAGFILFAVAILATLIFGRFFCGWACHVVAYQDLASWLLTKFGMKPKPVRSRFLVLAPFVLAFYMFFWPTVKRWWRGDAAQPLDSSHLMTSEFWATFPGFWMGLMTFVVCGFAVIWLLGSKGFCTYGCPYGALFGVADRFAPGKIRVTDACDGCGHCTVSCSSNVRVHEEVKEHKAVTDAGCMKCFDCVDVCPKDALYFGFGAPTPTAKKVKGRRSYSFGLGEELLLGALGLAFLFTYRGLYGNVPLLLSMGIAGGGVVVVHLLWRCFTKADVKFQSRALKKDGKLTSFGAFVVPAFALFLLFTGHSSFIRYNQWQGSKNFEVAREPEVAAAEKLEAFRKSREQLSRVSSAGVVGFSQGETMLATIALELDKDLVKAEQHADRALAIADNNIAALRTKYLCRAFSKDVAGARDALERILEEDPHNEYALKNLERMKSLPDFDKE